VVAAANLTVEIKAEAHHLGFNLVGITRPSPVPHRQIYEDWLASGRHGTMAYLTTERARQFRASPALVLEGCQSVISLGIPYHFIPGETNVATTWGQAKAMPTGRIAAYAWGSDYHNILPGRLQALASFISDRCNASCRWRAYTDTGPILERDLAQQAGLGWIGKNTCLIHPQLGSFFLLAELFLDLPLDPDPPFLADRCGACTRCLQACPTGCILPDRTIDARRCISYLTIELKDPIPADLRPLMSNWVFGCDVCQTVCPWNQRFAPPMGDPAFAPRSGIPMPDLLEELHLTPQSFNQRFRGSPVQRPRRRGYLRNVAIALGNHGDPIAVPLLVEALLHEPEPLVRGAAAWALIEIGDPTGLRVLQKVKSTETDDRVLQEIML
jgi:epoxyqueuosine reductase